MEDEITFPNFFWLGLFLILWHRWWLGLRLRCLLFPASPFFRRTFLFISTVRQLVPSSSAIGRSDSAPTTVFAAQLSANLSSLTPPAGVPTSLTWLDAGLVLDGRSLPPPPHARFRFCDHRHVTLFVSRLFHFPARYCQFRPSRFSQAHFVFLDVFISSDSSLPPCRLSKHPVRPSRLL